MRKKKPEIGIPVTRRVPQRTCVACRQIKAKKDLVRLVCNAAGFVEVDTNNKKPGRGAYLCRSQGCWDAGLGGRLEHELGTRLTVENRQELAQHGKSLCEEIISDNIK